MRIRLVMCGVAIAVLVSAGAVGCGSVDDVELEPDAGDLVDAAVEVPDAADQIAEAAADNDSLANPAERHFFSPTGEKTFTFTEEVSFPNGDATDFVEFEFPNDSNPIQPVRVTLSCTITGQANAQGAAVVFEDGTESNKRALCNDGPQMLTVNNTEVQVIRVGFSSVSETSHIAYSLTVDSLL